MLAIVCAVWPERWRGTKTGIRVKQTVKSAQDEAIRLIVGGVSDVRLATGNRKRLYLENTMNKRPVVCLDFGLLQRKEVMKHGRSVRLVVATLALLSTPTLASTVFWTDWLNAPNSSSASGEIVTGSGTIGVSYTGTGNHAFVQTGTGTNFWTGTAYTNGIVDNAPPAAELVALSQGGTVTISLSQPVTNPLIGLVSWNGNTVDFGVPIEIDSFGQGFWGNGTPVLNAAGTGFVGNGEVHGVLLLPGTHDTITFTHSSENWHGLTVGVVPEPATYALFLAGIALVGFAAHRRKLPN